MIGNGTDTYADSTLKAMTKDKLIEFIRCLEYNLRNAYEENELQRQVFIKQFEGEKNGEKEADKSA